MTARDSATQIVVTHSSDGGNMVRSVNASARLSGSSEDTTFGQKFSISHYRENGEVYTIWNYPKHSMGFSKSMDGGVTFSAPSIIQTYKPLGVARKIPEGVRHTLKKGVVRVESYPSMVCDIGTKHPGRLYLAFSRRWNAECSFLPVRRWR